jgi:hypothetical protein
MREVSGGEKQRLQQISGPLRHKDDKGRKRERGRAGWESEVA